MPYREEDLIQLSALQHYIFCTRQCALIHIEQVWSENVLTAEGRLMHERAHEEGTEKRGDVRVERGLPIRSLRLGLSGKADVVEFYKQSDGSWLPYPVEYKHGKPKPDDSDRIQLCAQALCLEEMLDAVIPEGALFYGKTRHRHDVIFDEVLRAKTESVAEAVHILLDSGRTPPPVYSKRCESCSLFEACMPKTLQKRRTVNGYLKRMTGEE
jgi:CRISPR-associated exonuclease Cas4